MRLLSEKKIELLVESGRRSFQKHREQILTASFPWSVTLLSELGMEVDEEVLERARKNPGVGHSARVRLLDYLKALEAYSGQQILPQDEAPATQVTQEESNPDDDYDEFDSSSQSQILQD